MQNPRTPQRKPTYAIDAVDNALTLLQLLRDLGHIRLKDAAAELGVAPSTAHRLLAMLVYRGFAIQDESRRYLPGPAMGAAPAGISWTAELRRIAQPYMELLASRLNETVNLMVRVGTQVRFLSTVEGSNLLRIGDRQGSVMPARAASGGKAILSELPEAVLRQLYGKPGAEIAGDSVSEADFPVFLRELAAIRSAGFAANFEGTEEGISALGVTLHNGAGTLLGAISVAVPSARVRQVYDAGLVRAVMQARQGLEADLLDFYDGSSG